MSATPTRSAGPLHAALASINSNWHGFLDAVRSPVAPPSQKRPRLAPEAERDASDTARGKRRRVEPDTAARKTLRGPSARKAAAGNTPGKRKAVPTGDFNFVPRPLVLPSKARPASVTPVLTLSPATSTRPSSAETTPGRYSRVDKGKARQVVLDPIDLTGPEAVEPLESALVGERVGRQLARSYQEVVEGEKRLRSERDEERRRVRELRAEIVKLTQELNSKRTPSQFASTSTSAHPFAIPAYSAPPHDPAQTQRTTPSFLANVKASLRATPPRLRRLAQGARAAPGVPSEREPQMGQFLDELKGFRFKKRAPDSMQHPPVPAIPDPQSPPLLPLPAPLSAAAQYIRDIALAEQDDHLQSYGIALTTNIPLQLPHSHFHPQQASLQQKQLEQLKFTQQAGRTIRPLPGAVGRRSRLETILEIISSDDTESSLSSRTPSSALKKPSRDDDMGMHEDDDDDDEEEEEMDMTMELEGQAVHDVLVARALQSIMGSAPDSPEDDPLLLRRAEDTSFRLGQHLVREVKLADSGRTKRARRST